jgi:hypothetical protein
VIRVEGRKFATLMVVCKSILKRLALAKWCGFW